MAKAPPKPARKTKAAFKPQVHVLSNVSLEVRRAWGRWRFLRGLQLAVVSESPLRVAEDFVGCVQLLRAPDGLGRSGIKIRMMLFGEQPIRGANLRVRAVTVEAECGVVIGFSRLQWPRLSGGRPGVSFIA